MLQTIMISPIPQTALRTFAAIEVDLNNNTIFPPKRKKKKKKKKII
jgi:hypothetical protein